MEIDAKACLERVQRFMRDEIARCKQHSEAAFLAGMEKMADDVDELVSDITREPAVVGDTE